MFSKVFSFLFGSSPKIFDKDGQVRHQLSKQRWEKWQKRYTEGDEYNWKNHTGMKASGKKN